MMMNNTVREYLLNTTHFDIIARFVFLKSDESEDRDMISHVIGGTLSVTKNNGVRRTVSITVENTGFDFLMNISKLLVLKFKLELGYLIDGTEYFFKQGIFVFSDASFSDTTDNSVTINATDKFSLINGELGGELITMFKVDVGERIADAIRNTLVAVGDTKTPILNISNSIKTPFTLEKDSNYGEILTSFNDMLSTNMYYDIDGRLRVEPEVADIYKETLWDYSMDYPHYQGGTRSISRKEVYNAVKVVGANVNGDLATGYSENNNPISDFSIAKLGYTRIFKLNDANIPNDDYAQQRSDYELKKLMAWFSSMTFNSIPLFHFDVDKIITITSDNLKLEHERHLLNSFSIPLNASGGKMNCNATMASHLNFV